MKVLSKVSLASVMALSLIIPFAHGMTLDDDEAFEASREIVELCREDLYSYWESFKGINGLEPAEYYEEKDADLAYCIASHMNEIFQSSAVGHTGHASLPSIYSSTMGVSFVEIPQDQHVEADVNLVVPLLYGDRNVPNGLFVQPDFVLSLFHPSGDNSLNGGLGVVYRFMAIGGFVGIHIYDAARYTFADEGDNRLHHRGSFGIDYQWGRNHLSLNYYLPFSGWVNIDDFYRERALEGVELRLESALLKRLSADVSVSYWNNDGDPFTYSDAHLKAALGFDFRVTCDLSVGLGGVYDVMDNSFEVVAGLSVKLGGKEEEGRRGACFEEDLTPDIWEAVAREKLIRLERSARKRK